MEEEKKLYPFRFCVLQDDYTWGSEEFRLADLGYRDTLVRDGWLAGNAISEVMDMYLDRVVGENVFGFYGRQFPVCIRTINVNGRMPLRVHPDDELAAERYDFLGKEKLWYVMSADADASLLLGFSKDTDASEVYSACLDNSVDSIMNRVPVRAGDSVLIPSGTPHAASGKMTIVEIAESSPLDFCMCGWGVQVSDEEFDTSLNLVDALDFITYSRFEGRVTNGGKTLADDAPFHVDSLSLGSGLRVRGGEPEEFNIYTCVAGEAAVKVEMFGQDAAYALKLGETILVPAECSDFVLAPMKEGTVLLETTVHVRPEVDTYINPDAEEKLPEEN